MELTSQWYNRGFLLTLGKNMASPGLCRHCIQSSQVKKRATGKNAAGEGLSLFGLDQLPFQNKPEWRDCVHCVSTEDQMERETIQNQVQIANTLCFAKCLRDWA